MLYGTLDIPIPHDNKTGDTEFMKKAFFDKPVMQEVCVE